MNSKRTIITLTLALLISGQSTALLATTYKWMDADGGIHYSQVPPTGKGIKILEVSGKPDSASKPTTMPSGNMENTAEQDGSAKQYNVLIPEQQDAETIAKEEAARRKQQQEACNALRNNLRILEQNTRIRVRSSDSDQPRVLTPEEREARMQQYRDDLDKMCQPSQ